MNSLIKMEYKIGITKHSFLPKLQYTQLSSQAHKWYSHGGLSLVSVLSEFWLLKQTQKCNNTWKICIYTKWRRTLISELSLKRNAEQTFRVGTCSSLLSSWCRANSRVSFSLKPKSSHSWAGSSNSQVNPLKWHFQQEIKSNSTILIKSCQTRKGDSINKVRNAFLAPYRPVQKTQWPNPFYRSGPTRPIQWSRFEIRCGLEPPDFFSNDSIKKVSIGLLEATFQLLIPRSPFSFIYWF